MKALKNEVSIPNSGSSKRLSKREHTGGQSPSDSMYARLRRLEQRIERIEAVVSTIRRDVYRIEKKQQRESVPSPIEQKAPLGIPEGLFV